MLSEPAVSVPSRRSAAGTWSATPQGSALALAVPQADLDALVAGCRAVHALRLPGVWPILDLVAEPGGVRLVTGAPLHPTLDELLNASVPIAPLALLGIVNEVGQTLIALQGAGWAHAELRAESVVLGPDGVARLCDAGVRAVPVVEGSTGAAPAWAELVELVAARRGAGLDLAAVAKTARTDGLDAALGRLAGLARSLRDDGDRRASLRAAVAGLLNAAPVVPAQQTVTSARAASAPRAAATMLGRKQRGEPETAASAGAGPGEEIRFGPGVAALPPAQAEPVTVAPVRKRRHRNSVVALVLVAAATALLWWLLHRPGPLATSSVTMTSVHPQLGCNASAELRAAVRTNGNAGTISYRWLRNDGTRSAVLRAHAAAGQHTLVLSMRWQVKGSGSYHGRATLLLLAPERMRAAGDFDYRCG